MNGDHYPRQFFKKIGRETVSAYGVKKKQKRTGLNIPPGKCISAEEVLKIKEAAVREKEEKRLAAELAKQEKIIAAEKATEEKIKAAEKAKRESILIAENTHEPSWVQ